MSLHWRPDALETRGGAVPIERTELTVPERWHVDGSRSIRLSVARLPGGSGTPVLFLSGGPGEGAIQHLAHGPFLASFRALAQDRPVVFLDQRGCGESDPGFRLDGFRFGSEDPAEEESFRRCLGQAVDAALEAKQAEGYDLMGYRVTESAQDVAALVDALGGRANLLAASYGTHLAQFVLKRPGHGVDRAVFFGFEGPDQTFKHPQQLRDQFGRLSALWGFDVSERLRAFPGAPVDTPWGTRHIGRFALEQMACAWCSLRNRFEALRAALQGDGLADAWHKYERAWSRSLAFFTKDQASGATPERWDRILSDRGIGRAANAPFPLPQWAHLDIGDEARAPLASDVPILAMTGELDGFTPNSNVWESAPFLPNLSHLELEGAAHYDFLSRPDAIHAAQTWLRGEAA